MRVSKATFIAGRGRLSRPGEKGPPFLEFFGAGKLGVSDKPLGGFSSW